MTEDASIFEYIFKGLIGIVLSVGAWLWVGLTGRVNKTENDITQHKIYVAENYIRKDVVDRIHDRIDVVSADIKEILSKLGQR